jgi:hypothetical protein
MTGNLTRQKKDSNRNLGTKILHGTITLSFCRIVTKCVEVVTVIL